VGTHTILIVDDEKNLRTTLADILSDEGYEVSTADSGERAIAMFDRKPYDLVLMDVRMPGMDGMEAFGVIRGRKPNAQVILMSAYSMDHLRRRCLDEGCLAFVRKPLDIESLLKLIRGTKEMTVLAVEREPAVSGEVAERLRREGYRVLVAPVPAAALETVRQIHSDVVFLDESFCTEKDHDLLTDIREAAPSSRIVLVTSPRVESWDPPLMVGPRCDAELVKPLRIAEVLALLTRLRAGRTPEPV
jgi:DNA-binding response OmpR family regulator